VADPQIMPRDGAVKREVRLRQAAGERAGWWPRADATYPQFPEYPGERRPRDPDFLAEPTN
jgi:hypothetical protein